MIVRPENAADVAAIDRVDVGAFLVHPHSRQTEHLFVRAFRAGGALTLSLVAEVEGRVADRDLDKVGA